METNEYKPGDIVPLTSPLYRVVHDPPGKGEQWKRFTAVNGFHAVQTVGLGCVMCFPADFSERKAETGPLPQTVPAIEMNRVLKHILDLENGSGSRANSGEVLDRLASTGWKRSTFKHPLLSRNGWRIQLKKPLIC